MSRKMSLNWSLVTILNSMKNYIIKILQKFQNKVSAENVRGME